MARRNDRLWRAFYAHRGNAKKRAIPFLLTFDQWLSIWQASGHIDSMGKGSGLYCMARFGDKGAYEAGNVKIITNNQNTKELDRTPSRRHAMGSAFRGKRFSKEHAAKIGAALKGRTFSAETKAKMSASARNRRK